MHKGKINLLFFCFAFLYTVNAQEIEAGYDVEAFEVAAEKNEMPVSENETERQQLDELIKNPIELNKVSEGELLKIPFLNSLLVQYFIDYRKKNGDFISLFELQAIPGWSISLIKRILPFVTLKNQNESVVIENNMKGWLLVRFGRDWVSEYRFIGDPSSILLRYKQQLTNTIKVGLTAEKDAGELFFRGKNKYGFDFYSGNICIQRKGLLHQIILGDYLVNTAQGLLLWQGLAFNKGTDVLNVKRQSVPIAPYYSSGEYNFNRGVALALRRGNFQLDGYYSFKRIDANIIQDSLGGKLVTGIIKSGLHTDFNAIAKKSVLSQQIVGFNAKTGFNKLQLGLHFLFAKYGFSISRESEVYNRFAFRGRFQINSSIDYSFTYKNMHLFGELALTGNQSLACLSGMLLNVSKTTSLGFVYRNFSAAFQSIGGFAFSEYSTPQNEKGFYSGLRMSFSKVQVDGFIDCFSSVSSRYNVNGSSSGVEGMIQIKWTPSKKICFLSVYRSETKQQNEVINRNGIKPLVACGRIAWRNQLQFVQGSCTLTARCESVQFMCGETASGALFFLDFQYKPSLRPFSVNFRIQQFAVQDFGARIYAYEPDVRYGGAVSPFTGNGVRYALNLHYKLKIIDLSTKFAYQSGDRTSLLTRMQLIFHF